MSVEEIEKTPRKTDFGNTGKFSARKIFLWSFAESGESAWSVL